MLRIQNGTLLRPADRIHCISDPKQEAQMAATTVQVEAARIPDRDRLLQLLQDEGIDARPIGEVELEVPCGDNHDSAGEDLLVQIEGVIFDLGAPFIPQKHEGVIYIRPPVS
jgi:hypothetical protein